MTNDKFVNPPCSKLEMQYANYFEVGYNAFEFVIKFSQKHAGSQKAELCTKIVTSPIYANQLLKILQNSMKQYEEQFGPIKETDQ